MRATYALQGVSGDLAVVMGYALPVAGIGFLVSILLDARMAVLTSVALATMTGIVFVDAGFALYAAIATIAPVPLVSAISSGRDQRRAIFISGLAAAVIAFSVAWFFHMALMPNGFTGVLQATAVAAVAGWVSSIIAIFLISAFESIFDITTFALMWYVFAANSVEMQALFQSGWFRPHNRSHAAKGVYLVGAGTHPGAGVPAVLASGKIAARLIAEREGAQHAAAVAR